MKKVMLISVVLVFVICLSLVSLGAKPASDTIGLSKGNGTYTVPANTWVSMNLENTAVTGHISQVQLLVDDPNPTGVVRMGVYTSTPCILVQDLGFKPVVDGWVTIDGLSISSNLGSCLMLAFILQNPTGIRVQKKGQTPQYSAPYAYNASLARTSSSSDAPPFGSNSNVQYVIRAIVTP